MEVVTDLSAAMAWGVSVPPWIELVEEPIRTSLAVPATRAHPRRAGVRGRRLQLPAHHLTTIGDQLVTTPARTWLDCSAMVPFVYTVAAGDHILRHGLATTDDLEAVVTWAKRRRGVRDARKVLPILDPRAESPGESLARAYFVRAGIESPECNVDIFCNGQWLARVDMLWRAQRLIVEYDGAYHLDPVQQARDEARIRRLREAGWTVLVFTAKDLADYPSMCGKVSAVLWQARGYR